MAFKGSLKLLLIKFIAVFSFFGGPMLVLDLLKVKLGFNIAFAICILPTSFMVLGALSMEEANSSRIDRFLVRCGLFSAWLILAAELWGGSVLFSEPKRTEHGLYVTGVLIGTVSSLGFIHIAQQWLQRFPEPEDPPF